jgi:hypothetical protein
MSNVIRLITLFVLLCLAACNGEDIPNAPTVQAVVFPTMTAGRVIRGELPPPMLDPQGASLPNPATAVALANLPTGTPNSAACPAPNPNTSLEDAAQGGTPRTAQAINEAITRYLSDGGSVEGLTTVLSERWGMLDSGFARADLDLTGEGTPDILLSYRAPDIGGLLLIFACADGRYANRYQATMSEDASAAPPQLLSVADLNYDQRPDLLFSSQTCTGEESCLAFSQLATWDSGRGRFINLLGGGITGQNPPAPQDVDGDLISELIVQLTNDGDSQTGPLRTGAIVYDWDGANYVRSYTQYDPPRFRIQVIHDADAAFRDGSRRDAAALYAIAINDPALENWQNDDILTLPAYARYRLLLSLADLEDPQIVEIHAQILALTPDLAAAPVYSEMAIRFWDALQATNNLHSACLAVLEVVNARPEATALLNRYGTSNHTYTAAELCPY